MAGDAGHSRIARVETAKPAAEENRTVDASDTANGHSTAGNEDGAGASASKTSTPTAKTASSGSTTTKKITAKKRASTIESQGDDRRGTKSFRRLAASLSPANAWNGSGTIRWDHAGRQHRSSFSKWSNGARASTSGTIRSGTTPILSPASSRDLRTARYV